MVAPNEPLPFSRDSWITGRRSFFSNNEERTLAICFPRGNSPDMTRSDATSVEQLRKRQAIEALRVLSEDDLKDQIVIPLFERRGLKCTSADRRHERRHRCDILMESDAHQTNRIEGAQLKANKNIRSKKYLIETIERASIVALRVAHSLSDSTLTSLSKYYWITSGDIDPIEKLDVEGVFGRGTAYFGRVEIWEAKRLVDEIQKTAPDLIPALEILQIEQNIEAERDSVV